MIPTKAAHGPHGVRMLGCPDPPVSRLLAQVAGALSPGPDGVPATLVLSSGSLEGDTTLPEPDDTSPSPSVRILVVSSLGAHPDARAPRLRRLWKIEEKARATGLPTLTLRLGPLLGPRSPLWLKLRTGPRLPLHGRVLLNPVVETDVVETLGRAMLGNVSWNGWYELAGPETMSLAELANLAVGSGPRLPPGSGAWEPPARELREHGLAESGPWSECFSIEPGRVSRQTAQWV